MSAIFKIDNGLQVNHRLYQQSYTVKEILGFFKDKYSCKECPFVKVYTGKMAESTKDIHRMYCKMSHVLLRNLPAIFGLSIEETQRYVERIKSHDPIAPDVVKIHPDNNKIFILSCILTKELEGMCIIDNYNEGKGDLSPSLHQAIKEWRIKHLGHK
jgi:hypothetical protein